MMFYLKITVREALIMYLVFLLVCVFSVPSHFVFMSVLKFCRPVACCCFRIFCIPRDSLTSDFTCLFLNSSWMASWVDLICFRWYGQVQLTAVMMYACVWYQCDAIYSMCSVLRVQLRVQPINDFRLLCVDINNRRNH